MRRYRFKTKAEFKAEWKRICEEDEGLDYSDGWQDHFNFDDDIHYQGNWFGKEIPKADYNRLMDEGECDADDLQAWDDCVKWSEQGARILDKQRGHRYRYFSGNPHCFVYDNQVTYDDLVEMKSHQGVRLNMLVLYKKKAMPVDKIFKIKDKVYFGTKMRDGSIKRFLPTTCKIIPKRIFNKVK